MIPIQVIDAPTLQECENFELAVNNLSLAYAMPVNEARTKFKAYCETMPFTWRDIYQFAMRGDGRWREIE